METIAYHHLHRFSSLLLLCCCLLYFSTSPVISVTEIDSFKAIKILHSRLDSDADGQVDDLESKQFLESDKIKDSPHSAAHKLRYLHQDGKDRSISVDELWDAWRNSQVYNWSTDETIYWLVNYVELPEYSEVFERHSINGTMLPRLATDSHFILKLGVTEPSARSKISIKALDVVLFGPPKLGGGRARDFLVGVVTLIAMVCCFVFYSRSRASQRALQAMQENLESLQRAEDQMLELQHELDKAHKAQEAVVTEKRNLEHQLEMQRQFSASNLVGGQAKSSNGSNTKQSDIPYDLDNDRDAQRELVIENLEKEIEKLRDELKGTYDAMAEKKFRAPFPLRQLLQTTYNIESQYYNDKKLILESKAAEVKARNQKLQKKKTSFLGYYKMAQENSLEEDLNTIAEVKEAIMVVTKEIKERTERWRAIEELCGCSLDLTPLLKGVIEKN